MANEIKKRLREIGFRPSRQRGQNFLIDKNVLKDILADASVGQNDWILEVGAGTGVLTQELAQKSRAVLAVEIDKQLTPVLAEALRPYKNVQIFRGDILSKEFYLELEEWKKANDIGRFKIVANLPYNITSFFLRQFLPRQDLVMVFMMVQREVAERMLAGKGEASLLSLSVQFYSQPKITRIVSRSCFWPAPEVDSALVKLDPEQGFKAQNRISEGTEEKMFQLMRVGFASRRKQLHNNLAAGLKLAPAKVKETLRAVGLTEKARAQELKLADWQHLASLL